VEGLCSGAIGWMRTQLKYTYVGISAMETIRITTDTSKHAGCGGLLGMSEDAPLYIVEHEGLVTRLPGVEMVCLSCGERIRSQDQVEVGQNS
jgi:hypothetical protein